MMDHCWFETCWINFKYFKYFIIILIIIIIVIIIIIIIIIIILTAIGLAPGGSSPVHIYREHYIEYTNNTHNT